MNNLIVNLFPNESDEVDGQISVVEVDGKRVAITPSQFLEGWQGRRPPFSNSEVRLAEPLETGTYEAAAWANDEVRARWNDPSGRRQSVVVTRRGNPVQRPGDPVVPDTAERAHLVYLNLTLKPRRTREPATVVDAATADSASALARWD